MKSIPSHEKNVLALHTPVSVAIFPLRTFQKLLLRSLPLAQGAGCRDGRKDLARLGAAFQVLKDSVRLTDTVETLQLPQPHRTNKKGEPKSPPFRSFRS
jgi:hypothetical protein